MPVLIVIPQGATDPIKISVGSGGTPARLLIDNIDTLGGVKGDAAGFFLAILISARDAVFVILSPITNGAAKYAPPAARVGPAPNPTVAVEPGLDPTIS